MKKAIEHQRVATAWMVRRLDMAWRAARGLGTWGQDIGSTTRTTTTTRDGLGGGGDKEEEEVGAERGKVPRDRTTRRAYLVELGWNTEGRTLWWSTEDLYDVMIVTVVGVCVCVCTMEFQL